MQEASMPDAATQEAPTAVLIRNSLHQLMPRLPKPDQISTTPVPGLYEVRLGTHLFYTDAQGSYLIRGEIIDLRSQRNLTQEREDKLLAIDFKSLPLQDAIVWKSGTGAHKMAVFADPNCHYCMLLEHELQQVKDVTVYTFMIPILGGDSPQKAQAIWCSKDRTQTWRDWMLKGIKPTGLEGPTANAGTAVSTNASTSASTSASTHTSESPKSAPSCATPMQRNLALAQKLEIQGTPGIFFEDGSRSPGVMRAKRLEMRFVSIDQHKAGEIPLL